MNPRDEPRSKRAAWLRRWVITVLLTLLPVSWLVMTTQPVFRSFPRTLAQVDAERLRAHVGTLSEDFFPRNYRHTDNLNGTASYVSNHFARAGGRVSEQVYTAGGRRYRNVLATFGPESGSRIVVGAHYDSYEDTPGADDNASGIAGLIELAYLLGQHPSGRQVELAAYTLEEPPFFRSAEMGSARHARRLKEKGIRVEAMICLEMIGTFSDTPGSQRFPSILLRWLYPDEGNFIAVITSLSDRKLARQVKARMRGATELPVHALCAPKGFPGLDFSDHRNYWEQGYRAVMITDTAFMRNTRYHRPSDTAQTLDYDRMAAVVCGVYEAVIHLARSED
jgi:hypothetical protein